MRLLKATGAFFVRSAIAPFEFALGLVSLWTGAISFFGITLGAQTLNQTMPPTVVAIFNLTYFISGIFIVLGLGRNYRNVEASGVILLATALVVRAIVVVIAAGVSAITITVVVQATIFSTACAVRLFTILKHKVLLLLDTETL
jgi:signal transduction histidine kinase